MMGDANRPSHLGEAIPKEPPLLWTTSQTDQFELAFQSPEKVPLEYLDDLGSTNKPGDRGATVSRERSTETGLVLAAKSAVFKNTCEDVKSEVEILRKLVGTRHIIQIVGTFMCGPNYTILLFPATQYNLSEYLSVVGDKDPDSSGDDKKHLSTFFGCLAKGLEYIHNSGVRHKDVKPENILVDLERKTICHADFGISKDFSGHDMSSVSFGPRVRGSKMYLSPECSRKMERSRPSDIFSLGCVFSEIWTVIKGLTLKEFYEQRSRGSSVADFCKTLDRVLAWIYHLDLLEPLSEFEEMGQVIISMLDELPSRRPSAKRVWAMFAGMTQVVAGIEHFEFCGSCCTPRPAELTRLLMANTSPKVELRNSAQEPANYEGVLAVILSWPTASNRPSYADRDISNLTRVLGPEGFNFKVISHVFAENANLGEISTLNAVKEHLRPTVENFQSKGYLIIFYYTGSGFRDDSHGELVLRGYQEDDEQRKKTPSQSTLRKKKLDNLLLTGAAADILEVYDTCNAGAMRTERLEESDRRHEILVSCSLSSTAPADGPCCFTNLFVECLERHPTGIDTALLHLSINNRVLRSLSDSHEPDWIRRHANPQSPIRFVLSGENLSPIRLVPQSRLR